MPPEDPDAPTPAEWKVLKIVFDAGSCAARDVVEAGEASFGWSQSTAKTLLRRLVDKGHLTTKRVGNSFLYKPSRSARRTLFRAADTLLDHAAEGTIAPLLAYMVKKSKLTDQELADLRRLLDEREGRS